MALNPFGVQWPFHGGCVSGNPSYQSWIRIMKWNLCVVGVSTAWGAVLTIAVSGRWRSTALESASFDPWQHSFQSPPLAEDTVPAREALSQVGFSWFLLTFVSFHQDNYCSLSFHMTSNTVRIRGKQRFLMYILIKYLAFSTCNKFELYHFACVLWVMDREGALGGVHASLVPLVATSF